MTEVMKKISMFILGLGILPIMAAGQCKDFTVFSSGGDVKMIHSSIKETVKKNMKVMPDSRLMVGTNSWVIILTGSDKAMKVEDKGSYTYTGLQESCEKNQTSLTTEYLKYVANSLIKKEEPVTAMVIKGAVYRSLGKFEKALMIAPADSSVLSDPRVRFSWHKPGLSPSFLLIYENGTKELYSKQMSDTTISLEASMFKPNKIYFWLICSTSKPSNEEPRYKFSYAGKEWRSEILGEWERMMIEYEKEKASMKKEMQDDIQKAKQEYNKK